MKLYDFAKDRFSKISHNGKPLVEREYQKRLCELLEDIIRTDGGRRVVINIPGGCGASLFASQMLPAYSGLCSTIYSYSEYIARSHKRNAMRLGAENVEASSVRKKSKRGDLVIFDNPIDPCLYEKKHENLDHLLSTQKSRAKCILIGSRRHKGDVYDLAVNNYGYERRVVFDSSLIEDDYRFGLMNLLGTDRWFAEVLQRPMT